MFSQSRPIAFLMSHSDSTSASAVSFNHQPPPLSPPPHSGRDGRGPGVLGPGARRGYRIGIAVLPPPLLAARHIAPGPQARGLALSQHGIPRRRRIEVSRVGHRGRGARDRRSLDGGLDGAARAREMLDVDFRDGGLDAGVAGRFALGGAQVAARGEFGVVFREQRDVVVEELRRCGQWVWRRDVDVVVVVALRVPRGVGRVLRRRRRRRNDVGG